MNAIRRRGWQAALVLLVSSLLVLPADAQRGRRGGGGGRGGGKGAKKKAKAKAKTAAKAQKAAEAQAQAALAAKKAKLQQWVESRKQAAATREAAIQSRVTVEGPAEAGPMFRTHCGTCHTVPDPAFPTDGAWLARLSETRCRELPPELALAMTSYLREASDFRPHPITLHAEPAAGSAAIRSDLEGEVFLRGAGAAQYRLTWVQGQAGEKRVVAPGQYTLTGYRVVRGPWMLSASGCDRTVALRPDSTLDLRVPPTVRIELAVSPAVVGGRLNAALLSLTLRDLHGEALSVYKDGKRLAIPFQVETRDGATQHGVLAYANDGRAEAMIEIPLGQAAFGRVDLPFDFPFPIEGSRRVPLPPAR